MPPKEASNSSVMMKAFYVAFNNICLYKNNN